MVKMQKPIVHPLKSLSERPLRYGNLWRVVALLADQAAESEFKYPNSLTAEKHKREFEKAVANLLSLHAEFWDTAAVRDSAEAAHDELLAERSWLQRNHLKSV